MTKRFTDFKIVLILGIIGLVIGTCQASSVIEVDAYGGCGGGRILTEGITDICHSTNAIIIIFDQKFNEIGPGFSGVGIPDSSYNVRWTWPPTTNMIAIDITEPLEFGKSYTINVPEGALKSQSCPAGAESCYFIYSEPFTLHFTTESQLLKISLDYSGDLIDKNGNLPWSESADIKLHATVLTGEAPSLSPVEGADIFVDSFSYSVGKTNSEGEIDFWLPMKEGGQYNILAKKGSSTSEGTIIDIIQQGVFHDPPHIITSNEMTKFALLESTKHVFGISPWDPQQHYDWCSIITTALGFGVPASKIANALNCIAGLMAFKGALDDYGYKPQVGDKNDIIEVQYQVAFTDDFGNHRSKDIVHIDLIARGLRFGGEQIWSRHFWCEPFTGDTWLPFKNHLNLLLNLHSPAILKIQFADGTYVGYSSVSGMMEGNRFAFLSNVLDEPFTLFIPSAPPGNFKIFVIGTGSGPYTLTAHTFDQDLNDNQIISLTGMTNLGRITSYDASMSEYGVITISQSNSNGETPVPEFPSTILPVIMIIGLLGAVLLIQRTREN